jgi:hypothetical protein
MIKIKETPTLDLALHIIVQRFEFAVFQPDNGKIISQFGQSITLLARSR